MQQGSFFNMYNKRIFSKWLLWVAGVALISPMKGLFEGWADYPLFGIISVRSLLGIGVIAVGIFVHKGTV